MSIPTSDITVVILAGGQARRMDGRDKALLPLMDKSLLTHILETLRPQAEHILINSNRPPAAYREFGLAVVADTLPGHLGPLAGLLSAFAHTDSDYVLTVPCDTPLLPGDLLQRLGDALSAQQADIATVSENGRLHAAIMLAHRRLEEPLRQYLEAGERRVQAWLNQQNLATADYSQQAGAFINVNTPAELAELEQHCQAAAHED